MAIKVILKNSQSEFVNTGFLFQGTYYVDDSHKTGLKSGFFCSVKGDGKSKCTVDGIEDQATLTYAGAKDHSYTAVADKNGNKWAGGNIVKHKADGIIYKQTARDMYGRSDDLENEDMLFPYGPRESVAIGLLKRGVLEISDTEKQKLKYFTSVDRSIGDVVVANNTTCTTTNPHGLRVGNKVDVNGIVTYVTGVTSDKVFTVLKNVANGAGKALCQIGDPIFLGADMEGDLPFTTIENKVSGQINQLVGYIESPIAVRIDLGIDLDPAINA